MTTQEDRGMAELPRIISVDDHVVEPPNLWQERLPPSVRDQGPRIVRKKVAARTMGVGGQHPQYIDDPDGEWADVWLYEDLHQPFMTFSAAIGFPEIAFQVTTFDQIRPGSWKQAERLADMDANHVESAVCFPNVLPRFAGQTFYERSDKELALLCVKAYNDWMIDEWCAGPARGRLIPLTIIPLWDPAAAADEIRRCAAKGSFAITFPENPYPLGLPSIHDQNRFWDPVFAACQETSTTLCMHIGSSSRMPSTAPDAPFIISSTLTFQNAMGSMLDFIFSATLERFPKLIIAYSEGQVGWMPYVLERADKLWEERSNNSLGSSLRQRPSSLLHHRIYGCVFDDTVGMRNRDTIGIDQICFETDYPHADSTFPHSKKVLSDICTQAGLNEEETYKFARGNAIRAFGLERFGITR
jgi:predicted TIM-barrel fold metal-dependent hydrolase